MEDQSKYKLEGLYCFKGLPGGSSGFKKKILPANVGERDTGLIPGSGRFPGGGHGKPLQCSCLENPMDRGAWRARVNRVAKSQAQLKPLSMHARIVFLNRGFIIIYRW